MDPITVIVAALAAGASSGLSDAVSQAVKDAYETLKSAVRDRLRERPDGELIVERHEASPEAWAGPLTSELKAARVDADGEVQLLAQKLLELLGEPSTGVAGKYQVNASGAQGVQVGDHSTQHNQFSDTPDDSSAAR